MTFDLDAARKEQQRRHNGLVMNRWVDAEEALTAALDEIERLRELCLETGPDNASLTRYVVDQRDAARELADKLWVCLDNIWYHPHDDVPDSQVDAALADYEAAKNPDGSWK